MTKIWYFLTSFTEAGLSVFGIRSSYEQPSYQVLQQIPRGIEIRRYEARIAVQTDMVPGSESAAFGKLFRYITGDNAGGHAIAMTAPVIEHPAAMPMTLPVISSDAAGKMQFFLPKSVVLSGVPAPKEPAVHVVSVPAVTLAVIRFSGVASLAARATETARLQEGLAQAGKHSTGPPIYLSYDPPFAIPFLRRNEVALPCD